MPLRNITLVNSSDPSGCTKVIGDCRLQAPATISGLASETEQVTGRLYIEGLTNLTHGDDPWPSVKAQLVFGPDGTAPDASWIWIAAAPDPAWVDTEEADRDQYIATLTLPGPAGSPYDYAYRVTGDAGLHWTLSDLDGAENGYDPAQAGDLQVTGGSGVNLYFSEYVEVRAITRRSRSSMPARGVST